MSFKVITEQHIRDLFNDKLDVFHPIISDGKHLKKQLFKILLEEGEKNPANIAAVFTDYIRLKSISDESLDNLVNIHGKIREYTTDLNHFTLNFNERLTGIMK